MKQNNKIIFFDLDDTLFNSALFVNNARDASFQAMIDEGLHTNKNDLWRKFQKVYEEKGPNSTKHYDSILESYGLDKREIDMYSAVAVMTYHKTKRDIHRYLPKGVIKVLKKLSKEYTLGIISSGIGIKQWEKLFRLEIDHFFDKKNIYITDSIEHEKNINLYQKILIHYKHDLKFKDLFMIGDKESTDITPANYVGFTTIRVKGEGKYNGDYLDSKADYKTENLEQILKLGLF
ncbi:MAG: HAD hydrolase-like protein [Candidatus Woesearchaeota archaeon]|jgi:putative hydrolase of the HAD superfamily|nr:HAD hydrolase-like protein [Candidatus Woesearchaeota archaeon]